MLRPRRAKQAPPGPGSAGQSGDGCFISENQRSDSLHKLQGFHYNINGAVAVVAFELRHNTTATDLTSVRAAGRCSYDDHHPHD
ncbi:MAG: hypothetical protein ACREU8_06585 [Gammaproteobacteria bacterium]